MRKITFILMALTVAAAAGCSTQANHLGNPLMLPLQAIGNGIGNASYNQTRGKVEVFVKTNHPALIADLRAGGGPTLTRAYDIADVPKPIRAQHTLQMQSDLALYASNLDATVVAIMVVAR